MLYSSFDRNVFLKTVIEPVGESVYIKRFDDTDSCFEYHGEWKHDLLSGFADYKRTSSTASDGAGFTFEFSGTGFGFFGASEESCTVSVSVDGGKEEICGFPCSDARECRYFCGSLSDGKHTAEVTVLSGTLTLDGGIAIE